MTPLLVVDGHHLLYRAWHGFTSRRITSRDKTRDLTAVFGFLAILRKTHREEAPGHEIIVAFDGEDAAARRQQDDPAYKAARSGADHTPIQSLATIKAALEAAGVNWLELYGREGDDLIATLARTATAVGHAVTCYSGDRDLYQIADGRVTILSPARRRMTPAAIHERFGVMPSQWPDYRALTGDPADGIPGIAGIGPKTAAALLADGRHIEHLASSPLLQTSRCRAVTTGWDKLVTWRDLMILDRTVPFPSGTVRAVPTTPMPPAALIMERLGLW